MPQVGETRTNPNNPAETATWNGQSWEIKTTGGARPATSSRGMGSPLPTTLQRSEDDDLSAIGGVLTTRDVMTNTDRQISSGELDLGPLRNIESQVRNWAGWSSPNSRNYSSFRSNLEQMRNASLRLNKGVQTEGDAQRAWNELVSNLNDEKLVQQRLREIDALNRRAIALRQALINNRRGARGLPAVNAEALLATDATVSNAAPTPSTPSRTAIRDGIVAAAPPMGGLRAAGGASSPGRPTLPPEAEARVAAAGEGGSVTFGNGQVWGRRSGKSVRLR